MRGLLLDQNIPTQLAFQPSLPVVSTTVLGSNPSDSAIWEYAQRESLVIVSKDADFSGRIILRQPPPWVVHLRFGNLRRKQFHALLARVWPQVETLLKQHKLVNVHRDRVEGLS